MGAYPASTAARVAPSAASNLSAKGTNTELNFSALPSERPPEITTFALISGGLSDCILCSFSHLDNLSASGDLDSIILAFPSKPTALNLLE